MNQLVPGAAPAAPLPMSPDPGLDPLGAALMGGGPDPSMMGAPPMDPMMMGAPAPSPFPTADPAAMGGLLEQLLMAQQADHAALQQQQTMALVGNPLFEALVSGAPLGPGAGQDAQAIGPVGDVPPAPIGMGL